MLLSVNVYRLKKELWKQQQPEGFRARKYVRGPDGEYKRDPTYVGEDAWTEDDDTPLGQLIAHGNLNDEEKAELLELLNGNRAEKGLPPLNSEFKEEGSADSLDASHDPLVAGHFLGLP